MENTSGQGKQAVIPAELSGWSWNWGAFLMNWVWGIFNKTYIALLVFVPLVGMFMPFVLGFKGNAWAWRNKKWDSIDHFRRVQRKWTMWGVIMLVFSLLVSAGSVFLLFENLKSSEPYVMAVDKVQGSKEVQNIIGAPIKPGWWMVGDISAEGAGGKAEFSIPLEGSKQKGTVFVKATKEANKWKIEQLFFAPDGGGAAIDLLKPPQPPPEAPPPDKDPGSDGKATVSKDKGPKEAAITKKAPPAAAPVVTAAVPQPVKPAVTEKKPAVAESAPALKEKKETSKPKKKYVKKSGTKRTSPAGAVTAKKKTPADIGRAKITAGDYQGAIKILSAAIAKNPGESINYRLRGNAYDNLGKREQAIEDWKKAAAKGDTVIQSYLVFLQVDWP